MASLGNRDSYGFILKCWLRYGRSGQVNQEEEKKPFRIWTLSVTLFLFSVRAAGFSLRVRSLLRRYRWTRCTENRESRPIVLVMHINTLFSARLPVCLAVVRTLAQMLTGCLSCFCRFTRTGPITTWPNLAVSASSRTWARTSPMESCWHRSSRS